MADSSSILDALFPSLFHSSPFLSRDNDALTKALQISISEPPAAAAAAAGAVNSPCSSISTSDSMLNPTTIPSPWAVDPAANSERSGAGKGAAALAPSGGRVTKRKSRASKRSQTTYINADPANFRQMVQQVTGIRFDPGMMMIGCGSDTVPPLVKPEPQRMPVMVQQGCLLPTLDTSAHMLSNQARSESATVRAERSTVTGGIGVESGAGMSFPTLESWGMIV